MESRFVEHTTGLTWNVISFDYRLSVKLDPNCNPMRAPADEPTSRKSFPSIEYYKIRCFLDKRVYGHARRGVDCGHAHLVPGVRHHLRSPVGVLLKHVGQSDVVTYTNPPGDRLADLTSSNNHTYISHNFDP